MSDTALNSFGKPLSMTPAAIRKRDYRARRDKQCANLSQAGPSRATRDRPPKRNGQVLPFNGRHLSHAATNEDNQMLNGQDMSHVPPSLSHGVAPSLVPEQAAAHPSVPQVPRPPSRRRDSLLRVSLYLTGLLLATAGLGSNATYTFSQGRDPSEYLWLGCFAVGMEVSTMILPVVISRMWRQRNFGHAAIALCALFFCALAVGMAAAGFVERTFGDAAAARGKGVAQYADIDADLRSARAKRRELKFVSTTQAAVDAAEAGVRNECWRKRDSDECTRRRGVLSDLSGRLAAGVLDDKLASEIMRLDAALAKAPPIANFADPQVEAVKGIVSQVSRHSRELDPGDVKLMRIFWFAVLPMLAGLMFAWADAIGEPRERKRAVADDGFRNRSPGIDSNLAGQVA